MWSITELFDPQIFNVCTNFNINAIVSFSRNQKRNPTPESSPASPYLSGLAFSSLLPLSLSFSSSFCPDLTGRSRTMPLQVRTKYTRHHRTFNDSHKTPKDEHIYHSHSGQRTVIWLKRVICNTLSSQGWLRNEGRDCLLVMILCYRLPPKHHCVVTWICVLGRRMNREWRAQEPFRNNI